MRKLFSQDDCSATSLSKSPVWYVPFIYFCQVLKKDCTCFQALFLCVPVVSAFHCISIKFFQDCNIHPTFTYLCWPCPYSYNLYQLSCFSIFLLLHASYMAVMTWEGMCSTFVSYLKYLFFEAFHQDIMREMGLSWL
jgi:hypothetical protein